MFKKSLNFYFITLFVFYSIYCALNIGITWDTFFEYNVGKQRLDYFFSLGEDQSYKRYFNANFYPGFNNTISAFIVQFFPKEYNIEAIHLINLSFSFFALFGISKFTKELFNKEISKIVFILCIFNPIFFGHMAMNGKDTIIVLANVWASYSIIKYCKYQDIKRKRKKFLIYAGLFIGIGLGVRYTFIVTLIPILIYLLLDIFYFKKIITKKFKINHFILDIPKVFLISYFLMILFWPQTYSNIFINPFKLIIESLSLSKSFLFGPPISLLNGEFFLAGKNPKNYILINLFYKTPEYILISFFLLLIFFKNIIHYYKKKINSFNSNLLLIFSILLFSNILLLFNFLPLYDGLRLFLYLIPYINIIAAILICYLIKNNAKTINKFFIISLISFKILFIYNFFSLTPYHYVYLNLLAGKFSENDHKFENDYWGISVKKLIKNFEKEKNLYKNKRINIATCGIDIGNANYYLKKIKNLNYKMVNQYKNENFDIIIMTNRPVWDSDGILDIKNARTCFQKFSGEEVISIKKRGLVLSKIERNIK